MSEAPGAAVVVRTALNHIMSGQMQEFFDMVSDDAVIELPFAPPGWPKVLRGREGLSDHLRNFAAHLTIQEMKDFTLYETTDPGVAIAQYSLVGVTTEGQKPYEVHYLQVVTVVEGAIVRYRDYWNPMIAMELAPDGFV